jgi:hypothetical protein
LGEPSFCSACRENLFPVLFSSDCRICGEPLVKISRLPVCQEGLDGMQRIRGECVSASVFFLLYALLQDQDEDEGAPLCGLCRRSEPPFARATAYGGYDRLWHPTGTRDRKID